MQVRMILVSSLLFAAGAAVAQPVVPCEGAASNGGNLTEEGECDGTDAIFCGQDGNVVRIPCAALFDGAPVGTCEVYPAFGSWCAFSDGDACGFQAENGNQFFACATDTSGCVNGVCTPNVGACTPSANGQQQPLTCANDTQVNTGCAPWAQSVILGCGEGLTCEGAGVCSGASEGGQCLTGVVECADGLSCQGENAANQTPGTCETAGAGEGEGEGEGGNDNDGDRRTRDEPEDAPTGCPFNATGAFPAFGALALLLLSLRRRR
jgi:MYXO-CTERM domain-containing protein